MYVFILRFLIVSLGGLLRAPYTHRHYHVSNYMLIIKCIDTSKSNTQGTYAHKMLNTSKWMHLLELNGCRKEKLC